MGLSLTQGYNKGKTIVYPHFIYHLKNYKRTKISTNTPCSVKHWNTEIHRVERGDKDYKLKNLTIQSLRTKLEGIILRYKNNDELLTPPQLLLELKKREKVKQSMSFSSLPLLTLVEGWESEYMGKSTVTDSTKIRTRSVIKHIKDFIIEVEKDNNKTLLIDDLDDKFLVEFMNWLFTIPTIHGIGLKPRSVSRRFKYLQSFTKYYSKLSKEYIKIEIPKELSTSTTIDKKEKPISFTIKELSKLVFFTEFNFLEPIEDTSGKTNWVESDKWKKHLSRDRQNREKKSGVVDFMYEETNHGKQNYTSWEVYKDFLVFLCSVGCRYSDGINMKVGDIKHSKRNEHSRIKDGVDGTFQFYQKKTNTLSTPRINEVSFMIYKKYSRGKQNGDYLFPLTKKGNQISSVKINRYIKQICKTIGFNRTIDIRKLGSKGIELERETKYLWELVTTHIGRKTYIKTMVLDKSFNTEQLMRMTGHSTQKVFHQYYSIDTDDITNVPNKPFLQNKKEKRINKSTPSKKELTLKEKIIQLKELVDIDEITQEEFDQRKKELINNI